MIVEDVRIKEKQGTIGHQHSESFITYYVVQIKVFDKWWSLDGKPESMTELDRAIKMRDNYLNIIKGRT